MQGQFNLHIEFQNSQGYIEKLCVQQTEENLSLGDSSVRKELVASMVSESYPPESMQKHVKCVGACLHS